MKIQEKTLSHNVQCPTFEELDEDYFEDNNIQVRLIIINFCIYFYSFYYVKQDYEDISDEAYLKYHNLFEKKEIDYRQKVYSNFNKKKSKKEIRKEIIETQKAYNNLYSTVDIDCENSENNINSMNIIKIKLLP